MTDLFDEDVNEKEERRARHARKFRPDKPVKKGGRSSKAEVREVETRIARREADREIREAIIGDV
jgi:hypothetical protein